MEHTGPRILALLTVALGACGETLVTGGDTASADITDGASGASETAEVEPSEEPYPPSFYVAHNWVTSDKSWPDAFHVEPDGRHLLTTMIVDRDAMLVRIDTATLEVAYGPVIDPLRSNPRAAGDGTLAIWPGANGRSWLFDSQALTFSELDPETLALTSRLTLPAEVRFARYLAFAPDGSAAALVANVHERIYVADLSSLTTRVETLRDGATTRLQVSPGARYLAITTVPTVPCDRWCIFPELDLAEGTFDVLDLRAPLARPVIAERGLQGLDAALSPSGRWLVWEEASGLVALDLGDDGPWKRRALPCQRMVELVMRGAAAYCVVHAVGGARMVQFDADFRVRAEVSLAEGQTPVDASPDGQRVLAGGELVDFSVAPPSVTTLAGGERLPYYEQLTSGDCLFFSDSVVEATTLLRFCWSDLQVVPVPVSWEGLRQLEATADGGFAIASGMPPMTLELFAADGRSLGVIERRPQE